ncbi:MAG: hypothetical protein MZV63_60030 [Marinilabiliales bacterium]|nr:hypothetical protein [Marinilabiliales bacterium]
MSAMAMASLSLDIASRVLIEKLSGDMEQEKLIEKYLNELDGTGTEIMNDSKISVRYRESPF